MLELLRQVISERGLTGTPEEIAAALNAKTIEQPVEELYTATGLLMELGVDITRDILARVETAAQQDPLLRSQLEKLYTTGLQLSHPLTLAVVDQLVDSGVLTPEHREAIRSVAFRRRSIWETVAGDGAAVTAEDVAAALDATPQISRQVLVSANADANGVGITVVVNTLENGRPAGRPVVTMYRTGGQLPTGDAERRVVEAIADAVAEYWRSIA